MCEDKGRTWEEMESRSHDQNILYEFSIERM